MNIPLPSSEVILCNPLIQKGNQSETSLIKVQLGGLWCSVTCWWERRCQQLAKTPASQHHLCDPLVSPSHPDFCGLALGRPKFTRKPACVASLSRASVLQIHTVFVPPTLEAWFHFITTLLGSKKALSKTEPRAERAAPNGVCTHARLWTQVDSACDCRNGHSNHIRVRAERQWPQRLSPLLFSEP